jgi:protein-S-isoprenylcysteine O-methyltransferase Ste14
MRVAMVTGTAARPFGRVVRGDDRADPAEALLWSLPFGIPMAVAGGTQEVGAFLARHPVYLAGTALFAVVLAVGVIYVADIYSSVRNCLHT